MVLNDNWNTTYYENGNLKAMISLGIGLSGEESPEFYVSLVDNEHNDIFQESFETLDAACSYINKKYQDTWELKSLIKTSTGGCSTCVAH